MSVSAVCMQTLGGRSGNGDRALYGSAVAAASVAFLLLHGPRVVETRTHLRGCLHYMRTCAAAVWCSRACVYTGCGPSVVSAPTAHAFVLAASSRVCTSVCSRTRYCMLRRVVGTVVLLQVCVFLA